MSLERRLAELERDNKHLRDESADLQCRLSVLLTGVTALLEHGPRDEILDLLQAAVAGVED